MTTPVATATTAPPLPPHSSDGLGASTNSFVRTNCSDELSIIAEAPALACAMVGFGTAGDLALEIQLLQARKSDAQATNEKHLATANKEAQIVAVQQRLEELARVAEEKASSEKSSFWSKVFKWVAVVVAAIAGALSAVFSAGAGAAIAAVVIAVVLASEQVVKAVTDALVQCDAITPKQASLINACFGVIEDIINQLAEAGALGEKGDQVKAVLNMVVGAAKAIVSCVVGGVSSVAEIVGAVCSLTAEAVRLAQEVVTLVYEACDKEGQLSQEMMLALSLIGLCLDIAGAACSIAEGVQNSDARGSDGSGLTRAQHRRIQEVVVSTTETGATLGEISFSTSASMDRADADEAKALAKREESRVDSANARIVGARRALEEVFKELEMVLDDVENLMNLDDQIGATMVRL